jgi:hypothetical protein
MSDMFLEISIIAIDEVSKLEGTFVKRFYLNPCCCDARNNLP